MRLGSIMHWPDLGRSRQRRSISFCASLQPRKRIAAQVVCAVIDERNGNKKPVTGFEPATY
jgi:hypothetical protein